MASPQYSSHEPAEQQPVLIYDGECRMCVAAKGGMERLGKSEEVRYIPYQSDEAARRLGASYKSGCRPDVAYLVDRVGRITEGLDAFVPLLPGLHGGRIILALMRLPFGRPLARLFYRIIAKNRYRWFGAIPSTRS